MEKNEYRVVRILLDKYILQNDKEMIEAILSGNMKKKGTIVVGDTVKIKRSYDKYVIEKVISRRNFLIRPPVANIDQMVIVMSIKNPIPDYMLLDKEIILCLAKGIEPVICINKIDLVDTEDEELQYIKRVYESLGMKVIYTSIHHMETIEKIKEILIGKVSAFSGNSGVGKSSIAKKILGEEVEIEVGEIGKKTSKGKHTTKHVELFTICKDTYLLDTPGFSSYELYDISHKEIKIFYPEFLKCKCDYEDCAHITEGNDVCDVKRKVEAGKIDKKRYERYTYIYQKLKEQYDRRYQ